jgi:hypothetical protein
MNPCSSRGPLLLVLLLSGMAAAGPVRQVPEGGKPIAVARRGVVCSPMSGGWTLSADGRSVQPPAPGAENSTRQLELKVAEDAARCASSEETVTVIATGALAAPDAGATTFVPDEGRLELRGQRLQDVSVVWTTAKREGKDLCLNPTAPTATRPAECIVPLPSGLPADTVFTWVPSHGRQGPDVTTYDANGNVVPPEAFQLRPGRVVLTRPLVPVTGVDLAKGPGQLPLTHPEAIAAVDCSPARCELDPEGVAIRDVPDLDDPITLRLRLAPRVVFAQGDTQSPTVAVTLPILSCPLTIVEGTALREAVDSSLVVRLDPACNYEPQSLVWRVRGERVEVGRVVKDPHGVYVLLRTPGTSAQQVSVTATNAPVGRTVVASATARTLPVPYPRAQMELPPNGPIDFIPTNRAALVRIAGGGELGRFTLSPQEGAYQVLHDEAVPGQTGVIGDTAAGGFVTLRFGYRVPSLPGELATTDLAYVDERVQRAVREASVPANIAPLIDFVCADKDGKDTAIAPSTPFRIPYTQRDTCRVIIHRERLKPEDGTQEIILRVAVTKVDDSARAESQLEQRMLLRAGGEARTLPIPGHLAQFDRILVQVSHVVDESRYALSTTDRTGLPSAQWSAIVTGGLLRLYATGAVPAGLYRATAPSGQLTLNFGVLSRLVLLNDEGKERLVGIEVGLMGLGLIPQANNVHFPPTLALVGGLGLRVPIGTGAAIGVQAWIAREFRGDITRDLVAGEDPATDLRVPASKWSFIFGPSISIGNVGFNL